MGFVNRAANLFLFQVVVWALFISACGPTAPATNVPATQAPAPTKENLQDPKYTLTILNPQAASIINPHLSLTTQNVEPSRITYEPLASFDKDGVLVPILATEIPSLENGGVAKDGKSVTWKLRQNVRWSDGEPFNAYDVEFTYKYVTNPDVQSATAGTYKVVSNFVVVDDYTVRIEFKDVTPAWALPFVGKQGTILPRHIFEKYNGPNFADAPANTLPVGTGPYRVVAPGIKPQEVLLLGSQIVKTNKIVFEPNPFFREPDKVFFKRIIYRGGGTNSEAARLVLQEGSVDFAYELDSLPPDELVALEEDGKGKLLKLFGSKVERILLNRTDPKVELTSGEQVPHHFFSDLGVRQAFAYAIDRNAIAALYGPAGQPIALNLVAPPQFRSSTTFYEFNPEKAKSLLEAAGWIDTDGDGIREKDGTKMIVTYQGETSPLIQKTQLVVQKNLKDIGVDVILKSVDPTIIYGDPANPDSAFRFSADIQEFDVRSTSPDPANYMHYWTCDRIPNKANGWAIALNFERACYTDYDELYKQSSVELNPEKRRQQFIQMNDLLIKEVVMIPIVYRAEVEGVSLTIEGIDPTPWDAFTWQIMNWRRVVNP
jgi:peptide/nickel transport system substrate-binding protein